MTRQEYNHNYNLEHRDKIRAHRRALAAERQAEHREYLDCAKLVCLFTTGHGCRCGFSKTAWNGSKKIAARRREVYARMAKITDGWRKK